MANPCRFVVFLILLGAPQDSDLKKPPKKPPIRIFPGQLRLNLDFVHDCPNISTLGLRIVNPRVRTTGNNVIVADADLDCVRVIYPITKTIISIFNCPDRASGDCPLFQTWRFGKESCALSTMKHQLWSPVFQNINPRLACPNPPGIMELRNGTLDMGRLQTLPFPLEQYYWRVRLEVFDHSMFCCVLTAAQVLRSHA